MSELVAALLLALGSYMWIPYERPGRVTWYGEEFLGRRHAASWHRETPVGFPEVVTTEHFGVAAPATIPFGTVLRLTFVDTCAPGCSEEAQEMVGTEVYVVVVDRMKDSEARTFDLWPAAAHELGFGPDYGDEDWGCIRAKVDIAVSVLGLYTCPYRGVN